MNESVLQQLGRAIGDADYPEAISATPIVDYQYRPAAPGPSPQPGADAHYVELKRAVDALPWRLVIASREAARLTAAVAEWEAVERAADAFVSARDK
jgi:hypothetical protein